ncbi:hypothetical protein FND50_16735 [Rhodococcus sp. WB9]|nr:hypothetical protein FND50_16735 [Rhodococcus sp. WB9]
MLPEAGFAAGDSASDCADEVDPVFCDRSRFEVMPSPPTTEMARAVRPWLVSGMCPGGRDDHQAQL